MNTPDDRVEKKHEATMTAVMRVIDEAFNGKRRRGKREFGVVIFVFPFGDHPGKFNYMSNGVNREDLVVLMKEMIARFEGQPEIKGTA